jgi:hypothetical protein
VVNSTCSKVFETLTWTHLRLENKRELVEKETTIIELRHEGYVWREIAVMVDMSIAGVVQGLQARFNTPPHCSQ